MLVRGVVGLEKVSPVRGECVPVLVVGMLVRGGALVGVVEVVELLLSEKQMKT